MACSDMQSELREGKGLRVKFEAFESGSLFAATSPLVRDLEQGVQEWFNTRTSVHLYHQTRGDSQTLAPHADPYDVVVVQLQGSKHWTACVPAASDYSEAEGQEKEDEEGQQQQQKQPQQQQQQQLVSTGKSQQSVSYSKQQLARLYRFNREREVQQQKAQGSGCVVYTPLQLEHMQCTTFTLHAGDTMYLPRGVVHYALSGSGGSSHLTLAVMRTGLLWADAVTHAVLHAIDDVIEHDEQVGGGDGGEANNTTTTSSSSPSSSTSRFKSHSQGGDALVMRWTEALLLAMQSDDDDVAARLQQTMPVHDAVPSDDSNDGGSGSDSGSESASGLCARAPMATLEQAAFAAEFKRLCTATHGRLQEAYTRAGDVRLMLDSALWASAVTARVCSDASGEEVQRELCANGYLPLNLASHSLWEAGHTEAFGMHGLVCLVVF